MFNKKTCTAHILVGRGAPPTLSSRACRGISFHNREIAFTKKQYRIKYITMKSNTALVIFYKRHGRCSFNALVGALDTDEYFDNLNFYFYKKKEQLIENLPDIINKHKKVIAAFSFCSPQLWETNRLISYIRKKCDNDVILIAGGPHPTGAPEKTLEMGFDIVIRGEGEETLMELLNNIDEDKYYNRVKGIAFIDDKGEYRWTGKRKTIDINKYPPFSIKHDRIGQIEITRGCPYGCYFCQTSRILGGKIRHRRIENLVPYVKYLVSEGCTDTRFITPNAFAYGSPDGKSLNIPYLEEFLVEMRKANPNGRVYFGSFPSEVRPEHVTTETVALVKKYADNDNLVIGGQSGSLKVLEACHRGHTVKDIYKAVENVLNANLRAAVDFIFGLPGEEKEDVELTIGVMKDLIKMGARIHAHTFTPLPQTPFSNKPPGKVGEKLKKITNKFTASGVVFGNWKKQVDIGEKLWKYLNDDSSSFNTMNTEEERS